jgi:hypothetical protein
MHHERSMIAYITLRRPSGSVRRVRYTHPSFGRWTEPSRLPILTTRLALAPDLIPIP